MCDKKKKALKIINIVIITSYNLWLMFGANLKMSKSSKQVNGHSVKAMPYFCWEKEGNM